MTGIRIEDAFAADGHVLQRVGSDWRCICPFHAEKTPSLIIQTEKQVFYCHGCHAKGDVVNYLVDFRKMGIREAIAMKKGETAFEGKGAAQKWKDNIAKDSKGRAISFEPKVRDELPKNHQGRFVYKAANGNVLFVIQRYHITEDGKTKKTFGQYTPFREEKTGKVKWINRVDRDRIRPLYGLPELLEASKDKQVLVPEGEGKVDAIRKVRPGAVATTWSCGAGAWNETDWVPVHGRRCLLMADGDQVSHDNIRALAAHLHERGCKITLCLPPITDEKYDVKDAVRDGIDVVAWIKKHAVSYPEKGQKAQSGKKADEKKKPDRSRKSRRPPPDVKIPDEFGDNPFFTILGNVDQLVAIKLRTNQVLMFGRTALCTPNTLIAIAPDENWWKTQLLVDSLSRPVAMTAGAGLLRIADRIGQIDVSKVTNRGATWNREGECVWHLGDRLLVDGHERDLRYPDGNIYVSGPAVIIGKGDEPVSADDRRRTADTLMRYRWFSDGDGQRMLGWMVTAMVGGVLDWRPHVWLLGASGHGKSGFIKDVMLPLFDTAYTRMASPTEAVIARSMRSSSLPLLLDEAEPDRRWMKDVLELARVAAAGDGGRGRADGTGMGFTMIEPRFSMLMSSTKLPSLDTPDNNRFTLVRPAAEGVSDWLDLKATIRAEFAPPSKLPEALRFSMVTMSREIAERASSMTDELVDAGMATRRANIIGSLSAGWWWWTGLEEQIPHVTPRSSEQTMDAADLIYEILNFRVRVATGHEHTLLDLCTMDTYEDHAAGYGVRFDPYDGLLIAPNHVGIRKTLARSKFANVDAGALLVQMPGVKKMSNPRNFGKIKARCVQVTKQACDVLGINLREIVNDGGATGEDFS